MLWGLVLTEAKVVLQARQPHVLTMAAETLSALLFPFSWQHVYIPILPARLLDILQAPVPFLIGIEAQHGFRIYSVYTRVSVFYGHSTRTATY